MIISKAPLRISFVGGGTDLKNYYSQYTGRVISATIDKFVYIVANPKIISDQFIVKYQSTEIVSNIKDLKHERFREALLDLGIKKPMELVSIADLPAKTGLGSSSSFSVALMKALSAYLGKAISKQEAAEMACKLEIGILKEPIGKQDQYASAFGGFNIFEFQRDGQVKVEPVFLDYKLKADFHNHILLFFTGITRDAGSVLKEQNLNIKDKIHTYRAMADSVLEFKEKLLTGDFLALAKILNRGWEDKKSLSGLITNENLDSLHKTAIDNGAWGGKVLGAGSGGCMLFLAPKELHEKISVALKNQAQNLNLWEFRKIPFEFSQSGADIIFNS